MQRIEIWQFSTLFLAGLVVGMAILSFRQTGVAPSEPQPQVAEKLATPEKGTLDSITSSVALNDFASPEKIQEEHSGQLLIRGDKYLIGGNYALALDNYRSVERMKTEKDAAILLRLATCFERQSDDAAAENLYKNAIRAASNPNHQILAIIGFSRTLAKRQRLDEAINLITEQVLQVDQDASIPDETRSHLIFQYAKILEKKALWINELTKPSAQNKRVTAASTDLTDREVFAVDDELTIPELLLAMIDSSMTDKPIVTDVVEGQAFAILQRPSDFASTITATVSMDITPVGTILSRIASEADLEIRLSENASRVVQGRSRAVSIRSTTLTSLLDQLLLSFDLLWYQDGKNIHVLKIDEVSDSNMRRSFAFDSAIRAFRRFGVDFPDSSSRQSALLSRAGMAVAQKKYDEAGQLYKELEQTNPINSIQAKLFFNRGKLSWLLNRKEEATMFFYLAVDQAMDPNIESSAYCLLSEIHMMAGQLDDTIKTARRGLATAETSEQRQIAILNSARAYLLNNDPFSANTALFRNQSFVTSKQNKKIAALLGAYARFSGLSDERRGEIARSRMLSAVGQLEDSEYQTFADCYVGSMAYKSLGFHTRAMRMLILATTMPDAGTWQREAMFQLGMLQKQEKKFQAAIATFKSLTEKEDRWRVKALYQVAFLYKSLNENDLCIETCRKLWQSDLDESQKSYALQLLGAAFQEKGEHHSAALCFAGMLPEKY